MSSQIRSAASVPRKAGDNTVTHLWAGTRDGLKQMASSKRCKRGQFLAELALCGLHKASLAVPLSLLWCSCSSVAPCISQSKEWVKSTESLQQDLFYSQATDQGHFQEDAVVTKNNETDSCSKAPTAKQQQSFTHDPFWYAVVSHWAGETCLMCAITHPALGNCEARFLSLRMDQQSAKGFSAGGRELTLLQRGQNKPPATSPVWLN